MKELILSKGAVSIVDDEVYEAANRWKWYLHSKGYAVRNVANKSCKIQSKILLHRWVLESYYNIRVGDLHVDHINRDKLDNRLENLRAVTRSVNRINADGRLPKSGYLGVYENGTGWKVEVWRNRKSIYLGSYDTPEEANQVRLNYLKSIGE